MQALDIRNRILLESFSSLTPMGQWNAGAFEYEVRLMLLDEGMIDVLIGWLCDNCVDNFVVIKVTDELIAGGTTNNKLSWDREKVNGKRPSPHNCPVTEFKIRMSVVDATTFRISWIL